MVALVQPQTVVICQVNSQNRMTTCNATTSEGNSFELIYQAASFSPDEVAKIHQITLNLALDLSRECTWNLDRINSQLILKPAEWSIAAFYPDTLDDVAPKIRDFYAQFTPRSVPAQIEIEPILTAADKRDCSRCHQGCKH